MVFKNVEEMMYLQNNGHIDTNFIQLYELNIKAWLNQFDLMF